MAERDVGEGGLEVGQNWEGKGFSTAVALRGKILSSSERDKNGNVIKQQFKKIYRKNVKRKFFVWEKIFQIFPDSFLFFNNFLPITEGLWSFFDTSAGFRWLKF